MKEILETYELWAVISAGIGLLLFYIVLSIILSKLNKLIYRKSTILAFIPIGQLFLLGRLAFNSLFGLLLIVLLFISNGSYDIFGQTYTIIPNNMPLRNVYPILAIVLLFLSFIVAIIKIFMLKSTDVVKEEKPKKVKFKKEKPKKKKIVSEEYIITPRKSEITFHEKDLSKHVKLEETEEEVRLAKEKMEEENRVKKTIEEEAMKSVSNEEKENIDSKEVDEIKETNSENQEKSIEEDKNNQKQIDEDDKGNQERIIEEDKSAEANDDTKTSKSISLDEFSILPTSSNEEKVEEDKIEDNNDDKIVSQENEPTIDDKLYAMIDEPIDINKLIKKEKEQQDIKKEDDIGPNIIDIYNDNIAPIDEKINTLDEDVTEEIIEKKLPKKEVIEEKDEIVLDKEFNIENKDSSSDNEKDETVDNTNNVLPIEETINDKISQKENKDQKEENSVNKELEKIDNNIDKEKTIKNTNNNYKKNSSNKNKKKKKNKR